MGPAGSRRRAQETEAHGAWLDVWLVRGMNTAKKSMHPSFNQRAPAPATLCLLWRTGHLTGRTVSPAEW